MANKKPTSKTHSRRKSAPQSAGFKMEVLSMSEMMKAHQERVRQVLRKEFVDFFVGMTTATPQWPAIPDEELTTALADALIEMGRQRNMRTTLLQLMVYELQERVNGEMEITS